MKKQLFLGVLVVLGSFLSAQQYTRIGMVNVAKIYELAAKDSPGVRELEELKNSIQKEVTRMSDELRQLEARKLEAKNQGNEMDVLNLDNEIQQKQSYQKEYVRVKQGQYNSKRDSLKQDTSFLSLVVQKIKEVAELKGFAMVLRSDDPNLIFYNLDSDITEDVLKQMNLSN